MDPVTIGLMVGGTILSAAQQRNAGIAEQQQANYQAQLMEIQAKQQQNAAIAQQNMLNAQAEQLDKMAGDERAVAQRKAIELARQKRLAQSRATAVAAASGGGALDPTVVDILGDLEAEGTYNFNTALWEGEQSAVGLEQDAYLKRWEGNEVRKTGNTNAQISRYSADVYRTSGKNSRLAGNQAAFSTIVSGAGKVAGSDQFSSMLSKYGDDPITWNGPRYTDNPGFYG